MRALAEAASDPTYPAEVALVLSNAPDAPGLGVAEGFGLPTAVVSHTGYRGDKDGFERAIEARVRAAGVELICLAGFMRVLSGGFTARWSGKLLNIHPSLLPALPGLDTHARALAAGVKLHGATVHLVTETVDGGPILAQAALAVRPDDTADSLADRVLALEHRLYPAALAAHLGARAGATPETALYNPAP